MDTIRLGLIPAHRGVMDRNFSLDRRARLLSAFSGVPGMQIVAPVSVRTGSSATGLPSSLATKKSSVSVKPRSQVPSATRFFTVELPSTSQMRRWRRSWCHALSFSSPHNCQSMQYCVKVVPNRGLAIANRDKSPLSAAATSSGVGVALAVLMM